MKGGTKILVGSLILLIFSLFSFLGPFFSLDPFEIGYGQQNLFPSFAHLFGTDSLGRDLFARVLQGLRISLLIGLCAAFFDLVLGVLWGAVAAFSGGRIERAMMRFLDVLYSLPYLLVVILVSSFLGTGFSSILTAMVLIGWIQMARMMRVLVKDALNAEYVQSAFSIGLAPSRVFFSHILPNIIGPLLAASMLTIPYSIFVEAFLSFLGIGIQPPQASLGSLISDALPAMYYYPWRLLFPAFCLSSLIFAVTLLSDGIRDVFDPRKEVKERVTI